MSNRIIIGKTDNTLYCLIGDKENQRKEVIEATNSETKKYISNLLDREIDNFKIWDNLLFVRTNDDLIVIEDYLQLNHDRVFKNFNKSLSKVMSNKGFTLEKRGNHRKAKIAARVLCCAALAGILIVPTSSLSVVDEPIRSEVQSVKEAVNTPTPAVETTSTPIMTEKVVPLTPPIDPAEEYFKEKVKEYSEMFFMDYNTALTLIEKNKESIKTEYTNEEVGIIRTLAEAFYDDTNISKKTEVINMSYLEREKLLLKFAHIYGINDIDTAATLLAIHRLETGRSTSDACINKNNFGGLRTSDNNGNYYVMSFKTPEIGAEAMVNVFINIRNRAMTKSSYNPNLPLEQTINSIYCGEASWPGKVKELKNEILKEYDLNNYITKDAIKQKILVK